MGGWRGLMTSLAEGTLKPWFHVKIKLFLKILGLHGTTSEMKKIILAAKIILFHFRRG